MSSVPTYPHMCIKASPLAIVSTSADLVVRLDSYPVTSSITGTRISPVIGGGDWENRQQECKGCYAERLFPSFNRSPLMSLSSGFVYALVTGGQQPSIFCGAEK